ncbi:hypothetical protein [Actinoplanes sp. L3-i22]|uniref:hypothetical protein n=1 Tax=Actinoplanes sp. L3-i22 TaxID=2836373 RepID=UPI001C797919|nr:hypothetical protein [Actinoplanes sp. L3-i22]BCY11443.1 hypothetical protein L3i22_065310 [Actinoplanes sp. L3-i22]
MTDTAPPAILPPRAAVVGIVTGLFLMAFFTLLWAGNTFAAWSPAVAGPIWAVFAVLAVGFIVQGVRLLRARGRFPAALSEADSRRQRGTGRAYGITFGLEGLAIGIVAALLNVTGHPDYVMPAIALIVGLHFYPMARIFGRSLDLYIATWTTLAGLAGIVAIAAGAPVEPVTGFVAVGAALATSAYGVYIGRDAQRLLHRSAGD